VIGRACRGGAPDEAYQRHMRHTAPDIPDTLCEGPWVRQRAAGRLPFAIALAIAFGAARVTPTYAHMGTGLPGGFESGFRHPFTGWDHLLAMVSVGLWGAFLGRPLIYALPVIFPIIMVGGAILGMFAVPMPPVELGIAVSVLVLGLCVCLAIEAPVWAACAIVATFAVFHGYAHGMELPSAADPVGYSVGFVLATGFLHVFGVGIGLLNARPKGILVTRSLGVAVALAGGWYLSLALGL
jgi:urease accessory protein